MPRPVPCSLTMATPGMALSLRFGHPDPGTPPLDEAALHVRLVDFVRALARAAAREDHAASLRRASVDDAEDASAAEAVRTK